MPIISCPDCGKNISSRAMQCPFCGCPSKYFGESLPTANDESEKGSSERESDNSIKSDDTENKSSSVIQPMKVKEIELHDGEPDDQKKWGMWWYYALMVIGLPANIIHIALSLYENYESLNALIISADIFLILYFCVVWYGMANFKKGSTYALYGAYVICITLYLTQILLYSSWGVIDSSYLTTCWTGILSASIILFISIIYYGHRKDMFMRENRIIKPASIILGTLTIVAFLAGIIIPIMGISKQENNYAGVGEETQREYVPMEYDGNVYISPSLGIKFLSDDSIQVESSEEVDKINKSYYEQAQISTEEQELFRVEMYANSIDGKYIIETTVASGYYDTDSGTDEFIGGLKRSLLSQFPNTVFSEEIRDTNFCGYSAEERIVRADLSEDMSYFIDIIIFENDGFTGNVCITNAENEDFSEMKNRFYNINDEIPDERNNSENVHDSNKPIVHQYVIIKTTGKLHSDDCPDISKINDVHKEYSDLSYEELIEQGYEPHECLTEYIGNSKGMLFHHADCDSIKGLADEYRVYGMSRQQLIDAGYEPCQYCNP